MFYLFPIWNLLNDSFIPLKGRRYGLQFPNGLLRAVRQVQPFHSQLCDIREYLTQMKIIK